MIGEGKKTIKIKTIFQKHWKEFWRENKEKYPKEMHKSIVESVEKMMGCGEYENGYVQYRCVDCGEGEVKVAFSCKGRFCARCGKVYIDKWVEKTISTVIDQEHRHVYFTIPDCLYKIFYWDRKLLKRMSDLAAETVQEVMKTSLKKKGIESIPMPGIITVVHTFGRNLKFRPHVHMLVAMEAIDKEKEKWIEFPFLPFKWFHKVWQYKILTMLSKECKNRGIKELIGECWEKYENGFVVELLKPLTNARKTTEYIGRYLGRPPVAEHKIIDYDGEIVTFCYQDLKSGKIVNETLSAKEFIGRLIMHIPKKHFQMVRRYGFYSRHVSGIVKKVLHGMKRFAQNIFDFFTKEKKHWRERMIEAFNRDPIKCPHCQKEMEVWQVWHPSYGLVYDFVRDNTTECQELPNGTQPTKEPERVCQLLMPFLSPG